MDGSYDDIKATHSSANEKPGLAGISQLPLEIQNQIYGNYYSTVTITYPHLNHWLVTWLSRTGYTQSLATYFENVEIHFNTTYDLVDFLFSLDQASLCRLRYISIDATPILIRLQPEALPTTFQISSILQLFPGLRLSTLKVRDVYCKPRERGEERYHQAENTTYNEVGRLVQSDGFKQLRYCSRGDYWLLPLTYDDYPEAGRGKATKSSDRNVQPECWHNAIVERDGEDSGSEVKAFQLNRGDGAWHAVREWYYDYSDYDEAENVGPEPGPGCLIKSESTYPVKDFGMGVFDVPGSVEIRVTRGYKVKYVQSGKSIDDVDKLLHELFSRSTWAEIKWLV